MSLGDHLRSQQYIVFSPLKALEDAGVRKFTRCCVTVHADHTRRWYQIPKLLLQLFRSGTKILDIATAAFWTDIRHRLRHVAVMAGQLAVLMVNQCRPQKRHLMTSPQERHMTKVEKPRRFSMMMIC